MKPITPWLFLAVYALFLFWINDYRFKWWDDSEDDKIMIVMPAFLACILGFIFLIAGVGASFALTSAFKQAIDSKPSETSTLVSLRSTDGITGSFHGGMFLGYGSIGSDMYYFYYEQHGKSFSPRKHRAGEGTYVYEEKREDAFREEYRWHFTNPLASWLAMEPEGTTTYFHVPEGSVLRGYKLQ